MSSFIYGAINIFKSVGVQFLLTHTPENYGRPNPNTSITT